jgi:hypothetical protein
VQRVVSLLNLHKIILIRSPPYTGKTSLAQLLERHLRANKKNNEVVIRLSFLGARATTKFPTFDSFWEYHTGATWSDWLYRKEPITLILDEVCTI